MALDPLPPAAAEAIFTSARSHKDWLPRAVAPQLLHELYALCKWGPTSKNCNPARFVFLTTAEARARLLPHLDAGNVEKVRAAPVTAIVAFDPRFHEQLDSLHYVAGAGREFAADSAHAFTTALRNSSLQGAYLIIAARLLGLDTGPISGFNNTGVDEEFFRESCWRSNFLCNLGYGNPAALRPRARRLTFEEACVVL
jgi:3-hydroxypropanoate dehydrogenase